jgi:tetratricopeptide (TPR) repeat protein
VAVALSLFAGAAAATVQARRAERRFNQVRRLANSVLYDFHDAIRDLPGSTRARETLVNTGLEYLDSLAREAGGDRSLLSDLAAAYQRVGDVQGRSTGASLGNTAAALASYRKALALAEEAQRLGETSEAARGRLIELHTNIANLLAQSNQKKEALESFSRAVAIGESIASPSRELLRELAAAYHDLARNQNDTTDSLANSRKHLAIVERLAAADPASLDLRRELSDGYSNTGVMLERRSDLAGAREFYQKAVELRQKLAAEDANNTRIQRELMIGYGHLGDVLGNPQRLNLGDRAGSARNYREAVAIAESLSKADPANKRALNDLAIAMGRLADTLDDQPGAVESLALYRRSNAILESLAAADPQNQRISISLANNHSRIADCLRAAGRDSAALAEYRASIELARRPAGGDLGARRQLRDDYHSVAALLAKTGDRRGAMEAMDRSVEHAEAIAAADPKNLRAASSRPRAYANAAMLRMTLARGGGVDAAAEWRSARTWLEKSVAAWSAIQGLPGFGPSEDGELAKARSAMEQCDTALASLSRNK